MKQVIFCTVLVSLLTYKSKAVNLFPRPSVYVVTPSPRAPQNEARSAPFYYHNWMRRIDSPQNASVTTTSTTPKVMTPDLIFAEFESDSGNDMQKSIRKLLEQERVAAKTSTTTTTTTTTSQPIYIPEASNVNHDLYSVPKQESSKENDKSSESDKTDYFALYNNLYNAPAPVYLPKTTSAPVTTIKTTSVPSNVENIWHIIDNEKHIQYVDKWEEVPIDSNKDDDNATNEYKSQDTYTTPEAVSIDENVALPGIGTNPGNGAENESRAIRTEPNFRFPYVSLKPFQVKNSKKPVTDTFSNNKKITMLTNLNNFKEMKYPVRGEVQEGVPMHQPIDRYNPAQPYLPQEYGSKSKQSSLDSVPPKTVASLVPPPPPPPRTTGDDFPVPTSYESFPPYAPSRPSPTAAPPSPAFNPPVSMYRPPDTLDDSGSDTSLNNDDDSSSMDLGYRYKPPSSSFLPTLPPLTKPFNGLSYDKPGNSDNTSPSMDTNGYSYKKPMMDFDSPPALDMGGYTYNKPHMDIPPISDEKPDLHSYHYDKPAPPEDHHYQSSHDHHGRPSYQHDSDYPDLIFNKPHDDKGASDMKENDLAMMAPPPLPDAKPGLDSGPPVDDSGFPHDFPGDFKFHHHDFDDDHDFHHYHHHHPTTTTTETPRVNRYSYYYLGKKLYYLPLYFSVYFIVYVGALIIKAVLRHKIVYPNSWKPDGTTATFFSKRSVDSWNPSNDNLHDVTGRVTKAIAEAAEKYMNEKTKTN